MFVPLSVTVCCSLLLIYMDGVIGSTSTIQCVLTVYMLLMFNLLEFMRQT